MKIISSHRRYFWSIFLIASFLIFICVSFGFNINFSKNEMFWFVISGVLVGFYYGLFNDKIFHYPKKPEGEYRNEFAKTNTMWIHLLSGFISGIAAYYLVGSIRINQGNINEYNLAHLVLSFIALLGYVGLLPMTLWFFANSGKLLEKLFKT